MSVGGLSGSYKCLKCGTKHRAEHSNLTCPCCGCESKRFHEPLLMYIDGTLADHTLSEQWREMEQAFGGDSE